MQSNRNLFLEQKEAEHNRVDAAIQQQQEHMQQEERTAVAEISICPTTQELHETALRAMSKEMKRWGLTDGQIERVFLFGAHMQELARLEMAEQQISAMQQAKDILENCHTQFLIPIS